PQQVDGEDHGELDERKPDQQVPPPPRHQTPDADAEKACEQDEIGEVREKPDVRRHPTNQRGFEEEDEKRRDEQGHRTQIIAAITLHSLPRLTAEDAEFAETRA